jgi:hypothetical protein
MVTIRGLVVSAGIAAVAALAVSTSANAAVTWTQIATPDVPGNTYNQLLGTALAGPTQAWSVGTTASPTDGVLRPLAERWTAAQGWQVVTSAPIASGTDSRFAAVGASSATDVWAVGQLGNTPATFHGLIEHWNGSAWTRIAVPAAELPGSTLSGVTAGSATDAWAVGSRRDPNTLVDSPLFEHWNGTVWSVVPGGALGVDAVLNGVTEISANDVWAVGTANEAGLTEHWDGTAWSLVAFARPTGESTFHSVTATASNDVWAVGSHGTSTLVEHWNGTAWSIVASPNGPNNNSTLMSVKSLSANDVWAVGRSTRLGVFSVTVTEHWDGTVWSLVASPNVAGANATQLNGVTGRTGGPLLGVGFVFASDGSYHTFGISG